MNPGMMLQIHRDDATVVQKFFTHFLPTIADTELGDRPNHYSIYIKDPIWNKWFGVETFDTEIDWVNIYYADTKVELDKIKFSLESWEGHGLFYFDFPAYENLIIEAHQYLRHWLFGRESEIRINIIDFDMDFKGQFKLDEKGYLDPVVYACDINFGSSDIQSDDWLVEFLMFEIVHFSFIVIQNTAWATGPFMFTNMLGPVLDKYLNHY